MLKLASEFNAYRRSDFTAHSACLKACPDTNLELRHRLLTVAAGGSRATAKCPYVIVSYYRVLTPNPR